MAGTHLLGIDIGTTGVRAAVFEATGALLAEASVPCMYDSPEAGWAEIRAERWWTATEVVLSEVAAHAAVGSLSDVAAIGVVGQAPTAVLVSEGGETLGPSVLWLDTRAHAEATELGVHAYYLG